MGKTNGEGWRPKTADEAIAMARVIADPAMIPVLEGLTAATHALALAGTKGGDHGEN